MTYKTSFQAELPTHAKSISYMMCKPENILYLTKIDDLNFLFLDGSSRNHASHL